MKNFALLSLLILLLGTGCKPVTQEIPVDDETDLTGGGGGSTPTPAPKGSVDHAAGMAGFEKSVYKFVRERACLACHGGAQSPKFAVGAVPTPSREDVSSAYYTALDLVNFIEPSASRFMVKISDGHCGSDCSGSYASTLLNHIATWKASYPGEIPGDAISIGKVFTQELQIPLPEPDRCDVSMDLACSAEGVKKDPDRPSRSVSCENKCWKKLRFPLKNLVPRPSAELSRAWFEIDFSYETYHSALGPAAYVLKNPRLISPDSAAFIHDVKLFINGKYKPNYAHAYRNIDIVVDKAVFTPYCTNTNDPTTCTACPVPADPNTMNPKCVPGTTPLFSTAASASGIIQENDPATAKETISFSFEYLQKGVAADCKNLGMWKDYVWKPIEIGAVACLNCHKVTGGVSEAGQRFNMDHKDAANGYNGTADSGLPAVCKKFLQRTNFAIPDTSPIIVQPRQGLNGMPAQQNFNYYSPDWIDWIECEKGVTSKCK